MVRRRIQSASSPPAIRSSARPRAATSTRPSTSCPRRPRPRRGPRPGAGRRCAYVILDGKLFETDRLGETVTSAKGQDINAWASGRKASPRRERPGRHAPGRPPDLNVPGRARPLSTTWPSALSPTSTAPPRRGRRRGRPCLSRPGVPPASRRPRLRGHLRSPYPVPDSCINAVMIRPRGSPTGGEPGISYPVRQSSGSPAGRTSPSLGPSGACRGCRRRAAAGHPHVRAGAGLAAVRDPHPPRGRAVARGGNCAGRGGRAAGQAAGVCSAVGHYLQRQR
jgi:hypothetical protein